MKMRARTCSTNGGRNGERWNHWKYPYFSFKLRQHLNWVTCVVMPARQNNGLWLVLFTVVVVFHCVCSTLLWWCVILNLAKSHAPVVLAATPHSFRTRNQHWTTVYRTGNAIRYTDGRKETVKERMKLRHIRFCCEWKTSGDGKEKQKQKQSKQMNLLKISWEQRIALIFIVVLVACRVVKS